MAWVIQLDFQDGNGWRDISDNVLIRTFKRDTINHNSLKPAQDTCTFEMTDNSTIRNLLLTNTDDVLIKITKDSADYFTGKVRTTFDIIVENNVKVIKVEAEDNGFRLRKKINSTFYYSSYKVCDTTTPSASIVHDLLDKAGYSSGEINVTDIDKTIDYFLIMEGETTYWDALIKLLFEFGYVFYHDTGGDFRIYDFLPSDTTNSNDFDNTNMYGQLKIEKKLEHYEGVSVKWATHETLTGVVVFSDTTDGDSQHKCNIQLSPSEYYPANSDTVTVYSEYNIQDRDIIVVTGAAYDIVKDSDIVIDTANYYGKRAEIVMHNSGAGVETIYKFDITGNAVVKGDLNKSVRLNVTGTEKIWNYDSTYITASADAEKLANGLARYYKYSDFRYSFRSSVAYDVGTYITITETKSGLSGEVCRIVKRIDNEYTGYINYEAEGVEEYSADTVTTTATHVQPAPAEQNQNNFDGLNKRPTYTEVQQGYTSGGGTKTPTQVTVLEKHGEFKASILKWDRQNNLTNFDKYQVQVTDCGIQSCGLTGLTGSTETGLIINMTYYFKININGGGVTEYNITTASDTTYDAVITLMNSAVSGATFFLMNGDLYCRSDTFGTTSTIALSSGTSGTDLFASLTGFSDFDTAENGVGGWYSLEFDMTDWKDTLDAYTSWYSELLVHTVPLRGTGDTGFGRVLAYRVRRLTKEPVTGTWSSTVVVVIRTVETGDVAKNIITANMMSTTLLNTLVANIRDYLKISDDYGYAASSYSNLRAYDNPLYNDTLLYLDKNELTLKQWTGFDNFPNYQEPTAAFTYPCIIPVDSSTFVLYSINTLPTEVYVCTLDASGNITIGSDQGVPETNASIDDISTLDSTHIIAIGDVNSSGTHTPKVWAGSISGTTISWGTGVAIASNYSSAYKIELITSFDTDRALLIYSQTGYTAIYGRVAKISGITITLGSEYTIDSSTTGGWHTTNELSLEKIDSTELAFAYHGTGANGIYLRAVAVSGTNRDELTISDSAIVGDGLNYPCRIISMDGAGKCLLIYMIDSTVSGYYREIAQRIINISGSNTPTINNRLTASITTSFVANGVRVDDTHAIIVSDYIKTDPNGSEYWATFFLSEVSGNNVSKVYGGGVLDGNSADFDHSIVDPSKAISKVGDWIIIYSRIYDSTTSSFKYYMSVFKGDTPSYSTIIQIGGDSNSTAPRVYGDGTNLILKPASGGRIIFDDDDTYVSVGTLHLAVGLNQYMSDSSVGSSIKNVDWSSSVPSNTKALLLSVYIDGTDATYNPYIRIFGGGETNYQKIAVEEGGALQNGKNKITVDTTVYAPSGKFSYQGNGRVANLRIALKGYYI